MVRTIHRAPPTIACGVGVFKLGRILNATVPDQDRQRDASILEQASRRESNLLQRVMEYRRRHGLPGLGRLLLRQAHEYRPRDMLCHRKTMARTGHKGYVINFGRYGFFANLFEVLGHVAWCERNGRVPLAYGGKYAGRSRRLNPYWSEAGYNGSHNVWEYYFEPLSGISIDYRVKPDHHDMLSPDFRGIGMSPRLYHKQLKQIEEIRERDSSSRLTPLARSKGYAVMWRLLVYARDYPDAAYRKDVHALMQRHVKIKAALADKIDAFHARHMQGRDVIGVHVRRTDHVGRESLPIDLDVFLDAVDAEPRDCRIFVATDCRKTLSRFVERYGSRVLHSECDRSTDGVALHKAESNDRPRIGEEVLVDAVLLSRARLLIHGLSNVASAAMFMNPHLECRSVWDLTARSSGATQIG